MFQIAFPKPAWFSEQPKQPFQSIVLQPIGRLPDFAGMKVESRPHTEHYRLHPVYVCRHPLFLLGAPQTHKKDSGLGSLDVLDNGLVFFWS